MIISFDSIWTYAYGILIAIIGGAITGFSIALGQRLFNKTDRHITGLIKKNGGKKDDIGEPNQIWQWNNKTN